MAILGVFIQSENGIPIYKEAWSPKIKDLNRGDELLISGFMSAIRQFASSFNQEIGYIRFLPLDLEFKDDIGVDSILVDINQYLAITFVDPFQFHDMTAIKLRWIYNKILSKYKDNISYGKTVNLTTDETNFIFDILHDQHARDIIDSKRTELIAAMDEFVSYNVDIRGVSINSFDNTILFNYGIKRNELENLLYYMGRGISKVSEYEILHKPIMKESGDSLLVCLTNPAISIEISDIIGDITKGTVPLYYYIITDADCSIGPVIGSLIDTLNPLIY
ncbi:MAG: hypothetical protein GF329_04015 [Candidatus Lokiarchaeota archaeon]|nr:hypothetical protein [Candidatus Lokiarchaeota archaeon]